MHHGQYKRLTVGGPGGMSCPCCVPQSGTRAAAKLRAKIKRQAKRRLKGALDREEHAEFKDLVLELQAQAAQDRWEAIKREIPLDY